MLYSSRPTTLPRRFRRPRVLIVGCGDVGQRVAQRLSGRVRVMAVSSRAAETRQRLCAQGVHTVIPADLDVGPSLQRLAGIATHVLHLAPPPADGVHDPRTRRLLQALSRRALPAALVYASTSGVYGDCQGDWVAEHRPVAPSTARAARRVDAERAVMAWARRGSVRASVLRIPGIYALDREGGTPRERLLRNLPALFADEDVFTNHIHADDLAQACCLALWRAGPQRTYRVSDDTQLRMGDYFDLAADRLGLPRPPRVSRAEAARQLSPIQLSFMSESRRLLNTRLKSELGMRLRHPTVAEGLAPVRSRPA